MKININSLIFFKNFLPDKDLAKYFLRARLAGSTTFCTSVFHNPGQYSASATVVGWGASEQGNGGSLSQTVLQKHGIFTTNLQKGELQVKPQSECGKISSTQICAGNEVTKTDSCRGDSGGGLFINSGDYPGQSFGNVHVQVGVVSYGSKLCGDAPGVYTKVEEFIPWIKEKINSS